MNAGKKGARVGEKGEKAGEKTQMYVKAGEKGVKAGEVGAKIVFTSFVPFTPSHPSHQQKPPSETCTAWLPPASEGWGRLYFHFVCQSTTPPARTAVRVRAARRAVCLLRSRRRTFLYLFQVFTLSV